MATPFDPQDYTKEIEQHKADMQAASDALARATKISDFAAAQWFEDDITLGRISKGVPPVDNATQVVIETERNTAEAMVLHIIPAYVGAVHGWAGGIQVLRSIESRRPGTITTDRLAFPTMPQPLADYAAVNGL